MLHFLYPRQSSTNSLSDSPSSLIPSSTFSTQSPSDSSSSLSSSESRTTSSSTPTTSRGPSSFTSTSTPTSTSTLVTPSSSSSSSSLSDTSSFISSSLSTSSTTTPPPSSSSSTSPVPSTLSSGFFLSTLTTSFVTDINGVPTTIVTPVVTALRDSTPAQSSTRTAVIVGSAVGGLVLFIIALSTIFILRRRVRRRHYWALSRKRLPSRSTFLAGESMDLPQPSPPFAYADTDDPFATRISRHPSGGSGGGGSDAPAYPYAHSHSHSHSYSHQPDSPPAPAPSSLPRLFRARASESGSIFQESVWPPPSAASQLTDPLTSPSHAVNLGRIVDDVMGPPSSSSLRGASASDENGAHHARDASYVLEETGPLLPHAGDRERELDAPPMLTLTNPDEPQSPLSPLQPPQTPPRPPRWLSRSPNPSPKNSPLHRAQPL